MIHIIHCWKEVLYLCDKLLLEHLIKLATWGGIWLKSWMSKTGKMSYAYVYRAILLWIPTNDT